MAHKYYERFKVQQVEDKYHLYHILNGQVIADFPLDAEAVAESVCRLMNEAYSEGHGRGMEYVKETLVKAMGFED